MTETLLASDRPHEAHHGQHQSPHTRQATWPPWPGVCVADPVGRRAREGGLEAAATVVGRRTSSSMGTIDLNAGTNIGSSDFEKAVHLPLRERAARWPVLV